MSKIQKLKDAKLNTDTKVILKYEDGNGVIHCHDDYESGVVSKTCIAKYLSEMIVNPSLGNNHILQEMREQGLLDDYKRGSDEFEDYVSEVISENWREYDWIETSTEVYDHKRGFTTVSVFLETTVDSVSQLLDFQLDGWDIEIDHPLGSLVITE